MACGLYPSGSQEHITHYCEDCGRPTDNNGNCGFEANCHMSSHDENPGCSWIPIREERPMGCGLFSSRSIHSGHDCNSCNHSPVVDGYRLTTLGSCEYENICHDTRNTPNARCYWQRIPEEVDMPPDEETLDEDQGFMEPPRRGETSVPVRRRGVPPPFAGAIAAEADRLRARIDRDILEAIGPSTITALAPPPPTREELVNSIISARRTLASAPIPAVPDWAQRLTPDIEAAVNEIVAAPARRQSRTAAEAEYTPPVAAPVAKPKRKAPAKKTAVVPPSQAIAYVVDVERITSEVKTYHVVAGSLLEAEETAARVADQDTWSKNPHTEYAVMTSMTEEEYEREDTE